MARRPCLISAVFNRKALSSSALANPRGSKAPPEQIKEQLDQLPCSRALHQVSAAHRCQHIHVCTSSHPAHVTHQVLDKTGQVLGETYKIACEASRKM